MLRQVDAHLFRVRAAVISLYELLTANKSKVSWRSAALQQAYPFARARLKCLVVASVSGICK